MEIIYNLNDNHIEQLHALYQQEWWSKERSFEATKQCVSGSQICIGIMDTKEDLIAFARVLTDYIFKALIFDVIVRKDQRGNGFGNKLISLIKEHQKLNRVRHFELYCQPGMQDFYIKHGFTNTPNETRLMRYTNEDK